MYDLDQILKNKKITFFVAETVPSFAGGGLNAFRFAKFLRYKACDVTILCYNYNNKQNNIESIDGVTIQRVSYYNHNILQKLLSLPRLIINYYKSVHKNDIGFIYGKYLIGYELIILFSFFLHKKIVFRSTLLEEDDMDSIRKQSGILWPIRKYIFSRIFCYYAINSSFSLKWKKHFKESPIVFQSFQGIDVQRFYPYLTKNYSLHKELCISDESVIFLSCGFLIERKGYRDIFNAMSLLKFPFVYIIVGQYSEDSNHRSSQSEVMEMKSLYAYGKNLLKDKIKFIGNTPCIENYYNSADVFIHGANNEIPNVLFEAMACGLPVICHKLTDFSEKFLVNNENCYEFSDLEELTELLKKIPDKKQELNKLGISALKSVRKYCAFDVIIQNLLKCLLKKAL